MTDEKVIKIGDLGASDVLQNGMSMKGKRMGTPLYLSPELVKNFAYDHKIDIWAVGCAMYHLACLEAPFYG
jgi:serine/threonine protein kinase